MKFKAKKGSRINNQKANVYGQEIFTLMKKLKKQTIKPEDIVEDATRQNAVYHDYFEWDDDIAGYEYRKEQARDMMRSIVQVVAIDTEHDEEVRILYHVVINDESVYAPKDLVFSDRELSDQVLEYALKEAHAWSKRYKTYKELTEVRKAIKDATSKIGGK